LGLKCVRCAELTTLLSPSCTQCQR